MHFILLGEVELLMLLAGALSLRWLIYRVDGDLKVPSTATWNSLMPLLRENWVRIRIIDLNKKLFFKMLSYLYVCMEIVVELVAWLAIF